MTILKFRKNAQAGSGHLILLLLVMGSVVGVGYMMLQQTHALTTLACPVTLAVKPPVGCLLWHHQISLQSAVTTNNCVYDEAGTWL